MGRRESLSTRLDRCGFVSMRLSTVRAGEGGERMEVLVSPLS